MQLLLEALIWEAERMLNHFSQMSVGSHHLVGEDLIRVTCNLTSCLHLKSFWTFISVYFSPLDLLVSLFKFKTLSLLAWLFAKNAKIYTFSKNLTFYIQNAISTLLSLICIVLVKMWPYVHTYYEYVRRNLVYMWLESTFQAGALAHMVCHTWMLSGTFFHVLTFF